MRAESTGPRSRGPHVQPSSGRLQGLQPSPVPAMTTLEVLQDPADLRQPSILPRALHSRALPSPPQHLNLSEILNSGDPTKLL